MIDLRKQLLAAFAVEYREHLDALRYAIDAAEQGRPVDYKEAFRRAHSLKGAARAVDLPGVEATANRIETILSELMQGTAFTADTRGAIEGLLDEVERGVAMAGQEPPPGPGPSEAGQPEAGRPETGQPEPAAPGLSDAEVEPVVEYLPVVADHVDALVLAMHDLTGELEAHREVVREIDGLKRVLLTLQRDWREIRKDCAAGTVGHGARGLAASQRFGLSLAEAARTASGLSRAHRDAVWSVAQAARRVKDDIDTVALTAVSSVFGSFGGIIRDMARDEGREAAARIGGGEVQADRRVLQQLKDPVLHLVRNAVSHGAQSAQERVRQGKPAAMEIGLSFRSRAGRLLLTVYDDGRGPDLAKIAAMAVERGLLPAGQAAEATPDQLLSLVFEPGFSTSAEVDRLSGRGMGLSVVAEAVRKLGGTVRLQSRIGGGAEAVLSVPLATALQPLLVVGLDGEAYALPTFGIERLVTIRRADLEHVEGRLALRMTIAGDEVVVPVQPLANLIRPGAPIVFDHDPIRLVVLHRGPRRCAVAVSELRDVRAFVVRQPDVFTGASELVMGTVLLDRTVPALVLHPEALIERWMREQGRLAASGIGLAPGTAARRPAPTVLVVDDSITTRTLQRSILEGQGYHVLLGVDGLDALETLRRAEAVVDLVIIDVEMPRMDGFSLLQALKNDARLSVIPVVMMTSRADPEDVRRGLALGADAYLTKQKFDQRELLATVGGLL